jgi:predicted acylesterase/phospholipase RssA
MSDATSEQEWGRLFCDLVMKGGITSGVVYPSAISRLAKAYRLRSLGGASAGAIAAAGGAVAEYRRQTARAGTDNMAGFDRLNRLAQELGTKTASGHTRLFQLFLPSPSARPVFSILGSMLNRTSKMSRVFWGVLGLLRAFPLPALLGIVVGFIAIFGAWTGGVQLPFPEGWIGASPSLVAVAHFLATLFTTLFSVLLTVGLSFFFALKRFVKVMADQDFGLCPGMRAKEQSNEPLALTKWLHELLQEIADKPASAPITFGDLRKTRFPEMPTEDGIVLRMMTTCLTGGRPYTMPIEDDHFYFDPVELSRYFPKDVIDWMRDPKRIRQDGTNADDEAAVSLADPIKEIPPNLLSLPIADEMPVILGVRMSLCFPILLSAIPLYRVSLRKVRPEPAGAKPGWERFVERVLFTDGGVCSNLPIHLFDAPLPSWPTFAINLHDDLQSWETNDDRAVRPKRGQGFAGDRNIISTAPELESVFSFLIAIVTTMQNWRDVLQRSAGGSRDRVVTVRHTAKEGGLNLDMESEAITRMAESGVLAAEKLISGFRPDPRSVQLNDDFTYHRWVRLRIQLRVTETHLKKLASGSTSVHNHPTISDLLNDPTPYAGNSYRMNQPDRLVAIEFLNELAKIDAKIAGLNHDFKKNSPKPDSALKVTPRF